MDQFISVLGQEGHALLVDCRSLDYRAIPLPAGVKLVVGDTGVRRHRADRRPGPARGRLLAHHVTPCCRRLLGSEPNLGNGGLPRNQFCRTIYV